MFYYFTTGPRAQGRIIWRGSEVVLQVVFNGASTASVSWMASSIFPTCLSSYCTLTTSHNPCGQPIIPISAAHPCQRKLLTSWNYFFPLGRSWAPRHIYWLVSDVFSREPVILSALSLHNCPFSHRQTLQTHSGSEAELRHAEKLTGFVSTPTRLEWENTRPKMRLKLQQWFSWAGPFGDLRTY